MIFLFPNDIFNPKQPDINYQDRFLAFKNAGFKTALIEIESLNNQQTKIFPNLLPQETVVYLGWMLSSDEYLSLIQIIKKAGAIPFTSHQEYLNTHYLPNWYKLIQEFTPLTKIYETEENLEIELKKLNWQSYFIKDYVKSLKTATGSIIDRPEKIQIILAEMKKYRGTIEGGICVRQVENFIPESEQRYFVIKQKIFAVDRDREIPNIVIECSQRIKSNFFSIDLINSHDGNQRIVEIGDGQVSDLVGWSIARYLEIWQEIFS
jgi:hypothetical protein